MENKETNQEENKEQDLEVPSGSEILDDKAAKVGLNEDDLLKQRKEKAVGFLKKNYQWISYIILAGIVWLAVRIRTSNVNGLRDVTTGGWTLGPDLDPFLFMRWAKHIVANGALMAVDMMRYSPIGYDTRGELILHPYMIAWFHNIAVKFGSTSVEQSAALYPAFFFAITVIAFFFLTRKIFIDRIGKTQANIIGLISAFFLSVLPSLLPRTIAGIPEKESAAFFFLFIAFYLFLSAWKAKKNFYKYLFSILAGVATAGMALVWGGYIYIFVTLSLIVFIAFIFGQVNREKFYIYGAWLFSSLLVMAQFSSRYSLSNVIRSVTTGIAIAVFALVLLHILLSETRLKDRLRINRIKALRKLPGPIVSIIVAIVIGLIAVLIFLGPSFVTDTGGRIVSQLVKPTTDRLGVTVAENRQPYFGEWSGSFGPIVNGFPIFFWLFFVGAVYLFYNMLSVFKTRERAVLTFGYLIFLVAVIFSRYSPNRIFDGENAASLLLYFGGILAFLSIFGYYYYRHHKEGDLDLFKKIDFGFLFLFSFFFFSLVSARGAVRLIMVLVPSTSILVSYLAVSSFDRVLKVKDGAWKIAGWILVALIIFGTIFTGNAFYNATSGSAAGYVPSGYNQQWQKAMSWVRENTAEDAVFGHWWDYGYWVQSIGNRATVLDGGNAIAYWNHLMGRHGLTGPNERDALEYLYAHNTTHFLIDSTDIGKYTAFSSIGSDVSYDRRSWLPSFQRQNDQTFETKDSVVFFYTGGFSLDGDIVYELDDEKIFLPGVNSQEVNRIGGVAGLGAVRVPFSNENGIEQPSGIYVYQGQQFELPLRYVAYNGEFIDFGSGVEAGIFLMQRLNQAGQQLQLEENGALIYLSDRTVKSQLARHYLYGIDTENFKTVHAEKDFILANLESQGLAGLNDIVFFNGVRGPIKIWEINYPDDIEVKQEYLDTVYPPELRAT